MAEISQETARSARRGRGPGRPFSPGVSGNAGGRPKGIKNFSIHQMVAEAVTDQATRADAIARLQEAMKNRRTVLPSLEFAARVNREIGLGSEDRPPGITIVFSSNLQPGALRRQPPAARRSAHTRKDGAA